MERVVRHCPGGRSFSPPHPWRYLMDVCIWNLGTRFTDRLSRSGDGWFDDFKDLFNSNFLWKNFFSTLNFLWFYDPELRILVHIAGQHLTTTPWMTIQEMILVCYINPCVVWWQMRGCLLYLPCLACITGTWLKLGQVKLVVDFWLWMSP